MTPQNDLFAGTVTRPAFDGETFEPLYDHERLFSLLERVHLFMIRNLGRYFTLAEIRRNVGGSEASISARLRDLRKEDVGAYTLARRRRGREAKGVHEYAITGGRGTATPKRHHCPCCPNRDVGSHE